jgi:hypothetical protein
MQAAHATGLAVDTPAARSRVARAAATMSAHDNALFAQIAALEHWMAALHLAHSPRETESPRAYAVHGQGAEGVAEGSPTLGPPSTEADGAC